MKVLVTGSDGFIGKTLVKTLEDNDHEVFKFDITNGHDVTNNAQCLVAFSFFRPDAVIHLAGLLGTHELFDTVYEAIDVNILGAVNILGSCVRTETAYVGITMPPVFPSIYTVTKMSAQQFSYAYHHNYALPVTHVRAFNAYGPDQKHDPDHPRKIIPAFATEGWQKIPLKIWGDGTQKVDLIHVDGVAKIFLKALELPGEKEVIDAGTGTALSVNEVADFVLDVTNSDAGVEHLPMRRGEIASDIKALGVGWHHLEGDVPVFTWTKLEETIYSYL